jgi:hypothetical protein
MAGSFWKDSREAAYWEEVVRRNPIKYDEGRLAYLQRIVDIVAAESAPAQTEPVKDPKEWMAEEWEPAE